MFTVYVLKNSISSQIYIGQTQNLDLRLLKHNQNLKSKKRSFTKRFPGTWKVVYKERYNTRSEALKREKQLKSYQGRLFIRRILGR